MLCLKLSTKLVNDTINFVLNFIIAFGLSENNKWKSFFVTHWFGVTYTTELLFPLRYFDNVPTKDINTIKIQIISLKTTFFYK